MRHMLLVFAFGFLTVLGTSYDQAVSAQCLGCREHLTGDMFGIRPGLAERGVFMDLDLTQFYQDVASGGAH